MQTHTQTHRDWPVRSSVGQEPSSQALQVYSSNTNSFSLQGVQVQQQLTSPLRITWKGQNAQCLCLVLCVVCHVCSICLQWCTVHANSYATATTVIYSTNNQNNNTCSVFNWPILKRSQKLSSIYSTYENVSCTVNWIHNIAYCIVLTARYLNWTLINYHFMYLYSI